MNDDNYTGNDNINRGYRDLEIWQDSIEFYVFVKYKIRELVNVPGKIKSNVENSVFYCSSNIAEGYSRRILKENIQYNTFALASLAENYSQVFALFRGKDIDKKWFDEYDHKHYVLENKIITYNKSLLKQLRNKNDWNNDYLIKELIEHYGIEAEEEI